MNKWNNTHLYESQFFTYTDWDPCFISTELETGLVFSNVTLLVPIGNFPIGSKFDFAIVSHTHSELTLGREFEDRCEKHKFSVKTTFNSTP